MMFVVDEASGEKQQKKDDTVDSTSRDKHQQTTEEEGKHDVGCDDVFKTMQVLWCGGCPDTTCNGFPVIQMVVGTNCTLQYR